MQGKLVHVGSIIPWCAFALKDKRTLFIEPDLGVQWLQHSSSIESAPSAPQKHLDIALHARAFWMLTGNTDDFPEQEFDL